MLTAFSRKWWAMALRGVVAILFGIMAILWPALTLVTLVLLFGAYAFLDGVLAVIAGVVARRRSERWWAVLLEGVAGMIIGLLAFFWPGVTALVLLYLIAAWALITGVLEIIAAIQLRRVITREWSMILSGLASIVFGLLLVFFPGAGALGLVWLIGAYAIAFGLLLLVLAFRLRRGTAEGGLADL
jgi:uncharacterized membrane protein HdeD (DUF308 family)